MDIAGAIYLLVLIQTGTGVSQGDRLMTKEACEFAGEVWDSSVDEGLRGGLRSHVCVPMVGPES